MADADRALWERAIALDRDLAAAVATNRPVRARWSSTVLGLAALSSALLLLDGSLFVVAALAFAAWPNPALVLLGVVALLFAVELRPRSPRWDAPGATELSPTVAPELWAFVTRIAAVVGAPAPDRLFVDDGYNAACGRTGLRRRPTLSLGLMLWVALTPQEQVALLGHELGHLVNGDPRRGAVTGLAQTTFGRLAWIFDPAHRGVPPLLAVMFTAVHIPCAALHHTLVRAGTRDGHRAEYLADAAAARAGGTDAMRGALECLLLGSAIVTDVERVARRGAPLEQWRETAATARRQHTTELAARARRSCVEDASALSTHPPLGWRWWVVSQWPPQPGCYQVADHQNLDDELDQVARAIGRQLDLT